MEVSVHPYPPIVNVQRSAASLAFSLEHPPRGVVLSTSGRIVERPCPLAPKRLDGLRREIQIPIKRSASNGLEISHAQT